MWREGRKKGNGEGSWKHCFAISSGMDHRQSSRKAYWTYKWNKLRHKGSTLPTISKSL